MCIVLFLRFVWHTKQGFVNQDQTIQTCKDQTDCRKNSERRELCISTHQDQELTNEVTQTWNTDKRRNKEHQEECKIRELTTHPPHQTHVTRMHTLIYLTT